MYTMLRTMLEWNFADGVIIHNRLYSCYLGILLHFITCSTLHIFVSTRTGMQSVSKSRNDTLVWHQQKKKTKSDVKFHFLYYLMMYKKWQYCNWLNWSFTILTKSLNSQSHVINMSCEIILILCNIQQIYLKRVHNAVWW